MQNIYFVVEPERVVALDLAHAIRATEAQAEVKTFARIEDALAALGHGVPRAIFLDREPGPFLASAVGQSLARDGIAMVFTSRLPSEALDGAEVLALPFSETTVAAVLRRLSARLAGDSA